MKIEELEEPIHNNGVVFHQACRAIGVFTLRLVESKGKGWGILTKKGEPFKFMVIEEIQGNQADHEYYVTYNEAYAEYSRRRKKLIDDALVDSI